MNNIKSKSLIQLPALETLSFNSKYDLLIDFSSLKKLNNLTMNDYGRFEHESESESIKEKKGVSSYIESFSLNENKINNKKMILSLESLEKLSIYFNIRNILFILNMEKNKSITHLNIYDYYYNSFDLNKILDKYPNLYYLSISTELWENKYFNYNNNFIIKENVNSKIKNIYLDINNP